MGSGLLQFAVGLGRLGRLVGEWEIIMSNERRPTLNVQCYCRDGHTNGPEGVITKMTRGVSSVKSIKCQWGGASTSDFKSSETNVALIEVTNFTHNLNEDLSVNISAASNFITDLRKACPRVVVILWFYNDSHWVEFNSATGGKYSHYLKLFRLSTSNEYDRVFGEAERWYLARFSYDFTLSFAGEDRPMVDGIQHRLIEGGARVFYDAEERASLLGKDLYQYFQEIYRDKSRYCVLFSSEAYKQKLWTTHELHQAQARAFESGPEYILPVKLDDAEIPGLNNTIGFVDARKMAVEEIAQVLLEKAFFGSYRKSGPAKSVIEEWSWDPNRGKNKEWLVELGNDRGDTIKVYVYAPADDRAQAMKIAEIRQPGFKALSVRD